MVNSFTPNFTTSVQKCGNFTRFRHILVNTSYEHVPCTIFTIFLEIVEIFTSEGQLLKFAEISSSCRVVSRASHSLLYSL